MSEKDGRRVLLQQWRFKCILLDQLYEKMRYQISHKIMEQQEKESLEGDFLLLIYLEQLALLQERELRVHS